MKLKSFFLASACAMAVAAMPSPQVSADTPPRVIEIKAKKFEFAPHQLTLKKGETVTLHLVSEDRVHGFFQRALGIDTDIDPSKAERRHGDPDRARHLPGDMRSLLRVWSRQHEHDDHGGVN